MKILVTGAAGFIGYHLAQKLLSKNYKVIGLDSLNNYYDINLKYSRLKNSGININNLKYGKYLKSDKSDNYSFIHADLVDKNLLIDIFESGEFDAVCNLAAQAGVRYSIEHPEAYIESNITGFLNILESCKKYKIKNLVYASSSSVYGLNTKYPFCENDPVDHPISLYASTKRSNELFAHTYSHLFGMHTNGLRFFTVYGPWGRPDMALFKFTKAALEGKTIDVFNNGNMVRDFTYIDDIVDGIFKVIKIKKSDKVNLSQITPSSSISNFKIYNIGNSKPVELIKFIELIEFYTGKKINKRFLPLQDGDVEKTYADTSSLNQDTGYLPKTSVEVGVKNFVAWYKSFYGY